MSGRKICSFDDFVVANFTQQCRSSVLCVSRYIIIIVPFVLYGVCVGVGEGRGIQTTAHA